MEREINKVHSSEYRPVADLVTYSPMPTRSLNMIDPFLFLNHHGPQVFPPNNHGLPFGPHPHRGMETVTFIIDGDVLHQDNSGHTNIISGGGIQWMTAGKGIIHSEESSPQFKKAGGNLELLQLWINLPASLKMATPFYKGLQKEDIPTIKLDKNKIEIQLISGNYNQVKGAFFSLTKVFLSLIHFKESASLSLNIPQEENILFYVVKGKISVNGSTAKATELVEFKNMGTELNMNASEPSILILGSAVPLNEPVVAQGPFVMNTLEEIKQAYKDYQEGKFETA